MDALVHNKYILKQKKILVELDRAIDQIKLECQQKGVFDSGIRAEKTFEVLYHSGEMIIDALLDSYKEVHDEVGRNILIEQEQDLRNELNGLYPREAERIKKALEIEAGKDCRPKRLTELFFDLQEHANKRADIMLETEKRRQQANIVQREGCGPLAKDSCDRREEIAQRRSAKKIFLDIPYGQYADCEDALVAIIRSLDLEPVIAKDKVTSSAVLCKICADIRSCKYGITDISSSSNSVAYEYGLMHGLGMKVCLLLRSAEEKFSDIHGIEHIQYSGLLSLKISVIKWVIDNVQEADISKARSLLAETESLLNKDGDVALTRIRHFWEEESKGEDFLWAGSIIKDMQEEALRCQSKTKDRPKRVLMAIPIGQTDRISDKDLFQSRNDFVWPNPDHSFPFSPDKLTLARSGLAFGREYEINERLSKYFEVSRSGVIYYQESVYEYGPDLQEGQRLPLVQIEPTGKALFSFLSLLAQVSKRLSYAGSIKLIYRLTGIRSLKLFARDQHGFNDDIGEVKFSDDINAEQAVKVQDLLTRPDDVFLDIHEEILAKFGVRDPYDRKRSIWDLEKVKWSIWGHDTCSCRRYKLKGRDQCLVCLGIAGKK